MVGGGWARGGACGQPEPGSGSGPAAPPCLEDAAAVLRKATSFPAESGRFRNCLACFLTFCNCSCCVPTLSLSQHRKTARLRHQGAAVSVYFVKGRALCSCSQLLSELACASFCSEVHTGIGKLSVQHVTVLKKKKSTLFFKCCNSNFDVHFLLLLFL